MFVVENAASITTQNAHSIHYEYVMPLPFSCPIAISKYTIGLSDFTGFFRIGSSPRIFATLQCVRSRKYTGISITKHYKHMKYLRIVNNVHINSQIHCTFSIKRHFVYDNLLCSFVLLNILVV